MMEDKLFYTEEGEPPSPPRHYYPGMGTNPQDGAVDPYPHSHQQRPGNGPPHPRGSPPKGGSALPRGRSAPRLINAPRGGGGMAMRGSPQKGLSRSPAGMSSSPTGGSNFPRGGRGGVARKVIGRPGSAPQRVASSPKSSPDSPQGRQGDVKVLRDDGAVKVIPAEVASPAQQFHHPHFHHHRSYRQSQGRDQKQSTQSLQSSQRSLSVSEQGSKNEQTRPRQPPVSSYSLDSRTPPDKGSPSSPYPAAPDALVQATAGSPYQPPASPPTRRNVAVTDLDQAMQERDESRLRSLFGNHVSSPNISFGFSPGYMSGFGETDVDETNLDDDPVQVKYVTNIHVPGENFNSEGLGGSVDREEERYLDCEDGEDDSQKFTSKNLDESVKYPMDMPVSLHFNQSDVFDGQLLLQWLSSQFDSSHYLSLILTKHDIAVLMSQFCTHLLAAGVLSQLEGQTTLREPAFKPNGQYFWTKQEPAVGNSELPGRLQPMWPPRHDEAETEARPGLKYTEAEHQAAMVLMRKDYNQQVDKLQKDHAEEIERLHGEYRIRLEDLRAEVARLEQEVEKYRQLAGIERLAQTALSHAQAAQEEAGLDGSNFLSGDGTVIAVTGTPQRVEDREEKGTSPRGPSGEQVASPDSVTLDLSGADEKTCVNGSPHLSASESDSQTSLTPSIPPPPPPPPPSLAGVLPPPPPPPPWGAPPPPPPPPGAPAPPPAPDMAVRNKAPSKPIVSTKSPMKPLFWKRIQVHTLKVAKGNSVKEHMFWENLEEAKISFDEFDDLFSKVPTQPKKKAKDAKPKAKAKQSAKVIEAKRSQAVGILLSTIRLEMSEIEHAILHLDTSQLDLEKFRAIYENRPTENEIKLIQKQLEKHPDVPLDKPEQFLLDLHQIPNCSDRIFCFIFQSTFQESLSVIDNKLNNLKMTCEMLTSGTAIKHIFGLILALGNYMNGGSRTRGQADGFELDILPKLKDYKAKDNRTSLIQYLVMLYVQRYEMDDAGTDKVKLPLPDPSDITQAGLVNFDDIAKEMARIRRDFDLAKSRAAAVLTEATEESKEPFDSIMKVFFEKGKQDLADQEEAMTECAKLFKETVEFFYMKPKPGENEVTPEYFFSLWHTFCQDFKDHWKREQQRIIKLRIHEAESRVRKMQENKKSSSIPTRAKTAGGLKDRLSRLSKK